MAVVTVVPSKGKLPSKKNLLIILALVVLITGVIAAVLLVQYQQRANIQACDCKKYTFLVTSIGSVLVTNSQTFNEPEQKATVSINGSPVKTFDVPALGPGQSQTLGTVDVPSGQFVWSVVGSKYCSGSGSYQGPSSTPMPSLTPTTTPIPSATPPVTGTPIPTNTPLPTATPILSPTPSSTPIPTVTPSVTGTPIPTTTQVPSSTPTSTPLITQIPSHTPTKTPTITPTPNPPDTPPAPPNRCNGDCTSDANCSFAEDGTKLICVNRLCRYPSCTDQISCHCPPGWPTPKPSVKPTVTPPVYAYNSPTPPQTLVQTADVLPTFTLVLGGLLLIGLGALLAL